MLDAEVGDPQAHGHPGAQPARGKQPVGKEHIVSWCLYLKSGQHGSDGAGNGKGIPWASSEGFQNSAVTKGAAFSISPQEPSSVDDADVTCGGFGNLAGPHHAFVLRLATGIRTQHGDLVPTASQFLADVPHEDSSMVAGVGRI
jgi:hypothetical protein